MEIIALSLALAYFSEHLPAAKVAQGVCLTEILHYEANGEGAVGKTAVANVVATRVESEHFPNSYCAVMKAPHAFSHRAKGIDLGNVTLTNKVDYKSFRKTLAIALRSVEGELEDITLGADHFFNPDMAAPLWANNPESQVLIGDHLFLRLYN